MLLEVEKNELSVLFYQMEMKIDLALTLLPIPGHEYIFLSKNYMDEWENEMGKWMKEHVSDDKLRILMTSSAIKPFLSFLKNSLKMNLFFVCKRHELSDEFNKLKSTILTLYKG